MNYKNKIPVWAKQYKPLKGKNYRHVGAGYTDLYWHGKYGAVRIGEIHCNKKGKITVVVSGTMGQIAETEKGDVFYIE